MARDHPNHQAEEIQAVYLGINLSLGINLWHKQGRSSAGCRGAGAASRALPAWNPAWRLPVAAGLLHHCLARMTLFLYLKIMPSSGFPSVNTGSSRCARAVLKEENGAGFG